eukprot:gene7591-5352_t
MDMDPITRREALKIEEVLRDLVEDLEMVSYLPEDFDLWLRDDVINTVEKAQEFLFPQYLDSYSEAENEERQRLLKARGFLRAAAHYGDPADSEGNEAVIQVAEHYDVERSILELASTVGSVGAEEMEFHHLSLRALIDTLREGGYGEELRDYLQQYFPPPTPSSSSSESDDSDSEGDVEKEKEQALYNAEEASAAGILSSSVENIRHVVHLLHRIIQLRNASTVNEDVHRYKVLHEAVNKEQSATADVQALNREYEEVKASRKRDVAYLDDEIKKLEEELQYVQRAADVELDAFHEVSAKIQSDHRQAYQEQLEVHRQAAAAVREKMKQAQLQHQEVTNQLRSLRAKKEAAVSGAIQEYESQMTTMNGVIEKLQKEYEEDTMKVLELGEKLDKLHTEKKDYEVELQVREKREAHEGVTHEAWGESAKVLQAYFRAYIARVHYEREVAKKKKGKKKGKKNTIDEDRDRASVKAEAKYICVCVCCWLVGVGSVLELFFLGCDSVETQIKVIAFAIYLSSTLQDAFQLNYETNRQQRFMMNRESAERAARIGELAFQKMDKVSAEFFAISYGAMVHEMVADLPQEADLELVNQQLEESGRRIGARLIEEYSVRSGAPRCHSCSQATESVGLIGLKMFLGTNAEVTALKGHQDTYSIVLDENPLAMFVELPEGPMRRKLWYSNILCGVIAGALAMVGFQAEVRFAQDKLRGDPKDEIVIRYQNMAGGVHPSATHQTIKKKKNQKGNGGPHWKQRGGRDLNESLASLSYSPSPFRIPHTHASRLLRCLLLQSLFLI